MQNNSNNMDKLDTTMNTDIFNYSNLSPASHSFDELNENENDEYFEDNGTIYEIENQFILRMPSYKDGRVHSANETLKEALLDEKTSLKERLFIDLNPDTRLGTLKFDDQVFKGKLVDLPCIIESLKTVEKKTFYKTADICQMFMLRPPDDENLSGEDEPLARKQGDEELDKRFQYQHGITPPLKNVLRKRFRKIAKKKAVDYAEIEKEVKRLFRADRDAFKVEYEVITVDEPAEQQQHKQQQAQHDKKSHKQKSLLHKLSKINQHDDQDSTLGGIHSPAESSNDGTQMQKASGSGAKLDFLGDISSSSDSDFEDITNKILKNKKASGHFQHHDSFTNQNSFEAMDLGDESTNLDAQSVQSAANQMNEDSNINYFDQTTTNASHLLGDDLSESDEEDEHGHDDEEYEEDQERSPMSFNRVNQMKLECLHEELEHIQMKRKKQEDDINHISNPVLKGRLLPLLNDLIEEEKLKKIEIEHLKSKMNE